MISVIIPVLNKIDWTISCLQSIRENIIKPQEIIIVDNGSSDNYKNIVEIFRDLNILYLRNETNLGVNNSWNLVLQITKKPYILFLNNDTVTNKFFIKKVLKTMEDSSIGITFPIRGTAVSRLESENLDEDPISIDSNYIEGWAFTMRKSIFDKFGPIPKEFNTFMGDTYFFKCSNLLGMKNVQMINNTVYHYGSLTLNELKSQSEQRSIHKLENNLWLNLKDSLLKF